MAKLEACLIVARACSEAASKKNSVATGSDFAHAAYATFSGFPNPSMPNFASLPKSCDLNARKRPIPAVPEFRTKRRKTSWSGIRPTYRQVTNSIGSFLKIDGIVPKRLLELQAMRSLIPLVSALSIWDSVPAIC